MLKLGLPPPAALMGGVVEGEIVNCWPLELTLMVAVAWEPTASVIVTVTDSVGVLSGTGRLNVPPLLSTVDGTGITDASVVVTV